ncbi:hypothetical protein [Chitinophaga sp. LS1]|uniref:hypothetical protein n=1 Tax=Chitinophaga sp. LS1 TaxID=3051176 RepID=UPI002AABA835|nr:hypothetical protein [Chitinophaga sp. LS1]WPV67858.1 hypothetical protein QQL36_03860 [Chitinophaga sp. LS1]
MTPPIENDHTSEQANNAQLNSWQTKLLPWVLSLVTIMILVFFALATIQFNYFRNQISSNRTSEIDKFLLSPKEAAANGPIDIEYTKLYCLAKMEETVLNKRYSQLGFLLLSRTYIKYLGFFTGMILSITGAVFVISKFKEEKVEIGSDISEKIKFTLATSSPGIIFGILGTILMSITIFYNSPIGAEEQPFYLNQFTLSALQQNTVDSTAQPNQTPAFQPLNQ